MDYYTNIYWYLHLSHNFVKLVFGHSSHIRRSTVAGHHCSLSLPPHSQTEGGNLFFGEGRWLLIYWAFAAQFCGPYNSPLFETDKIGLPIFSVYTNSWTDSWFNFFLAIKLVQKLNMCYIIFNMRYYFSHKTIN